MTVYICVNIVVIILSVFFFGILKSKKSIDTDNHNIYENKVSRIFNTITFLLLLVISGFRGDFTSDYNSYSTYFKYINTLSFREIFTMKFYEEKGYIVLNKIIGVFTNNSVYFMLIISIIILVLFYREFKRESSYIWFSILLFINIGAYYVSFNITRQILSAAIVFSGSKFLYDRKFIKYLLIVIIASLIHRTSLIMIPFYFILNYRFKMKYVFFTFLIILGLNIYMDKVILLVQKFYYAGYTYGMTGGNITSVVVPIALFIFLLVHIRLIDTNNKRNNILVNSLIFYVFFCILGLRTQMIQRFAEFFSPYVLILIPNIVSKVKDKHLKTVYFSVIIFLLVLYNYVTLSGTGYDPYYFIW